MTTIEKKILIELRKVEPFKVKLYNEEGMQRNYSEYQDGNSIKEMLFNTEQLKQITKNEEPKKISIYSKDGKFVMRFNESEILQ
jgi:hypothetical protein